MQDQPFDDIDSLFARAGAVDLPDDFLSRVMDRLHRDGAVAPSPRLRGWAALCLLAYGVALASLALLAYELGAAMGHSGTSTLLAALVSDVTLLADAPSAYLSALLTSMPWLHLAGVVVDLLVVAVFTRLLTRGDASRPAARRTLTST